MAEEKVEEEKIEDGSCRVSILVRVSDPKLDLSKCAKSLSNQILDDMEVLFLTNDESDLLDDYAKKDGRIRVIRTKVTDYGTIMNAGIKFSKGEYIGIVEPTDYMDPEMYIELFSLAKKHDADIVRSNYFEQDGDGERVHESFLPDDADKVINPVDDTSIFYQPPVVGCGLYKKEFLIKRDLWFLEKFGAGNQSDTFSFKTLIACERLVLSDKAYLHHIEIEIPEVEEEKSIKKILKKKSEKDKSEDESKDKEKKVEPEKNVFLINDEYAEAERFLKKYNGWKTYGKIFQAVKFASYFYTMLHLEDKDLEKFMLRARAEFHDADDKEMLAKDYFPKEHWKTLQAILKYPPRMFLNTIKKYRKGNI